jgi:hypothetical protein
MPSAETITKWVGAVLAGVIMALQGLNIKVGENNTAELERALQEIHSIHAIIGPAMEQQQKVNDMQKQIDQAAKEIHEIHQRVAAP